ncbi:twin-arginine translocation signal domain-containing protein [Halocalculus aciditolerans]|uniref:Uncharacterized protein n=1 Tax=Halocalculus aciditolerans TaxID=1383812 RepID=A0A830F3F6_9EURY|nr:twin-arginine translocation signal domain-containing protein [Halocalculus aciditolerans]GGL58798.1 hypothetical protein GCM10009039_16290 [Halocalculus aciditolerans]
MNRRSFLGAVAAGGAAAAAGCSTSSGPDSSGAASDYPLPSVDESAVDGWAATGTQSSTFTFSAGPVTVEGYGRTRLYEDAALRETVRAETLGQFDRPLAMFFATRVSLEGYLNAAIEPMVVADRVAPRIRAKFEARGIRRVERTDTRSPTPDIDGAQHLAFDGVYPTPTIEREVEIPDVGTRTLELAGGLLPIHAFTSVWKPDRNALLLAGGAYPAADYAKRDTVSVSGDGVGDGVDVTASVSLDLETERTRTELVALAETVS